MRNLLLGAIGIFFVPMLAFRLASHWMRDDIDRMLWLLLSASVVIMAIWLPDVLINGLLLLAKNLPYLGSDTTPPPTPGGGL